MHRAIFLSLSILCLNAASIAAQTVRPFYTDRPTRTDCPYSVPKGWLQVELDAVSHGELQTGDETITGTSIASFNVKYGITRRVDLQFVFSPWVQLHTEAPGFDGTDDGTGQAGLRAKYNLTGNDAGDISAGLIPFAYVPTRGDETFGAMTFGITVPVVVNLGNGRSMSSMLGVMSLESSDTWVIGSVLFGTPIAGSVAGFFEVYVARAGFAAMASEDVTADAGLTFAPSSDWQFDAGVYYGLTETTEDWRVFAGASTRFSLSR